MGTQDGLVRFNGIQFTVYTKANVDAFKHNDTRALFQDKDGTLWVGMFGGGLVRYKDGRFTAYTMQNGLSNNFVSSILRDHNGSLWIGTNDGLNELSGSGLRRFGINDGLSDNTIQALAEDAEGHLLVATKRGLDMLGEHKGFVRFSASIPAKDSVLTLLRDQKHDLWVGTESHGLYRLSRTGVAHFDLAQGLPRVPISTIYQDAKGTIWVGTNGSGMTDWTALSATGRKMD
jgi:ligand-binding sensor domain-containing protein